MILKKLAAVTLLLCSSAVFAQESSIVIPPSTKLTNKQVLDSLKTTFVHDDIASCIDSLWMNEMVSLDLYDELTLDIKNIDVDQKVDYELPTELLKERLKKLDAKSPFKIEYNEGLENVIKSFLKNRRHSFERLMGISQFYFPVFEEALAAKNIPLEIKYLAVVESALNPKAVSRVGATGLWQFMYQTGKQYDLNITSYVDERSDPLKASKAASQYMENMYKIFGDWDLVLASYNSGPGNVSKAIRRSGGKQNYWEIRKHLLKETQGYLPAFLATMYIFEYHKEHGIKPDRAIANHFATDTIKIKNALTFKQISDLLDVPVSELKFLNPSYKRDEIPNVTNENHFLRLPIDKIAVFTSNEEKIYAYVQYENTNKGKRTETALATISSDNSSNVKYHKVRHGESLGAISNRYGVTISELKKWNHLKSNSVHSGKSLKIYTQEEIAKVDKPKITKASVVSKDTIQAVASTNKTYTEEQVVSYKDVVKHHKVQRGDNLGKISSKYDVSVADIKKWNHLKSNTIAKGTSIKIIKNERVVSIVRKEVINENSIAEKDNSEDGNATADGYYTVQKGDNLYTIAQKYHVSINDLKEWNNIIDNQINNGTTLVVDKNKVPQDVAKSDKNERVAAAVREEVNLYYVKKGDSLFSIAKKYPGVTISDIKKWNGIKNASNLKPGMKLKING